MTTRVRRLRLTALLTAVVAAGCTTPSSESEGTGTTTATATTTTSGAETTAGDVTTSPAVGTSSSGAASTDDGDTTTGWPPYEPLCPEPANEIIVTTAETPTGPLSVDLAWLGHAACYGTPYVALVQLPAGPGELATEVLIRLGPDEGIPSPWTGTHPASVGISVEAVGTVEFLEPLQWAEVPDGVLSDHHLHARIEVHDNGWDLSVELDLIDCGAVICFCPCE